MRVIAGEACEIRDDEQRAATSLEQRINWMVGNISPLRPCNTTSPLLCNTAHPKSSLRRTGRSVACQLEPDFSLPYGRNHANSLIVILTPL